MQFVASRTIPWRCISVNHKGSTTAWGDSLRRQLEATAWGDSLRLPRSRVSRSAEWLWAAEKQGPKRDPHTVAAVFWAKKALLIYRTHIHQLSGGRHIIVCFYLPHIYFNLIFLYFLSHLLSSPFLCFLPPSNSDPGSHSRPFSPFPTTVLIVALFEVTRWRHRVSPCGSTY